MSTLRGRLLALVILLAAYVVTSRDTAQALPWGGSCGDVDYHCWQFLGGQFSMTTCDANFCIGYCHITGWGYEVGLCYS